RALLPRLQQTPQALRDRSHADQQFVLRQASATIQMPRLEHCFDDVQATLTNDFGLPAIIDALLEISLQMCPAQLPILHRPATVRAPAVAAQHAGELLAQDGLQSSD